MFKIEHTFGSYKFKKDNFQKAFTVTKSETIREYLLQQPPYPEPVVELLSTYTILYVFVNIKR